MAGRRYNPATQAIIEGMLKQKINPVDDGLKTDAARGFAAGLMGKPGYDTSTWHGALRGAGDKMLGAYMLKQSDQKYADQRQAKDAANDTLWNQALATFQSEQDADAQRQTLEDERWEKEFGLKKQKNQAELAKLAAETAKANASAAPEPAKFSDVTGLGKRWESETADYMGSGESLAKMLSSARQNSAAGDMGMIFILMKVLDPGSTVREGEQASAQNAAGVPERVRAAWNNALTGQRLTPAQRKDFVSTAHGLFTALAPAQENRTKYFTDLANAYGINPESVVYNPYSYLTPQVEDYIRTFPAEAAQSGPETPAVPGKPRQPAQAPAALPQQVLKFNPLTGGFE